MKEPSDARAIVFSAKDTIEIFIFSLYIGIYIIILLAINLLIELVNKLFVNNFCLPIIKKYYY
jgi:hypothetical protein